jgi:hypothetical protein
MKRINTVWTCTKNSQQQMAKISAGVNATWKEEKRKTELDG